MNRRPGSTARGQARRGARAGNVQAPDSPLLTSAPARPVTAGIQTHALLTGQARARCCRPARPLTHWPAWRRWPAPPWQGPVTTNMPYLQQELTAVDEPAHASPDADRRAWSALRWQAREEPPFCTPAAARCCASGGAQISYSVVANEVARVPRPVVWFLTSRRAFGRAAVIWGGIRAWACYLRDPGRPRSPR